MYLSVVSALSIFSKPCTRRVQSLKKENPTKKVSWGQKKRCVDPFLSVVSGVQGWEKDWRYHRTSALKNVSSTVTLGIRYCQVENIQCIGLEDPRSTSQPRITSHHDPDVSHDHIRIIGSTHKLVR